MRKFFGMVLSLVLAAPFVFSASNVNASKGSFQEQTTVPQRDRTPRRDRRSGRGIGSSYKKAGKGAARGGKLFGKNIAKGKPIKAGKEFGKGMGSFGKHTGKGTARVGKKIGRVTKKAVKEN